MDKFSYILQIFLPTTGSTQKISAQSVRLFPSNSIQHIKSDGTITKKINGMLVKECVKKVYIDLILEGQYIFRRKAILGNKVRFCCKPCEALKPSKYVVCYGSVVVHDPQDPEFDEYILDESTVPSPSQHYCSPSGRNFLNEITFYLSIKAPVCQ